MPIDRPPARTVRLEVAPDGDGWRVSVGDGETLPVGGRSAGGPIVDAVYAAARRAEQVDGTDAERTRAEDQVGVAFAAALATAGPAWAHLQALRGRAEALGAPPLVLVHLDDPALEALPWELLVLDPVAGAAGARVVRWGREPTSAGVRSGVARWPSGAAPPLGLREVDPADGPAVLWVEGPGAPPGPAEVVVLASPTADPADAWPERGAALVVVGEGPASPERWRRFASGFAGAIGRGGTLGAAVAEGREAVRAWGAPEDRWWRLRFIVGGVEVLDRILAPAGELPPGWPRADPTAGAWVAAAGREARRRGDGYLGVEHLLRALATLDGGGPVAAAARRSAVRWLVPYDEVGAGLIPQRRDDGALVPTPRVERLGIGLGEGFGLEALAARLVEQLPLPPVHLAPGDHTLDSRVRDEAAHGFEVVGGPEDGRLLELSPGDSIGRAGGGATVELYVGTRLTDRRLSRRHVVWDGTAFSADRPIQVLGPDGPRAEPRAGDAVVVTAATRLRAVGADR